MTKVVPFRGGEQGLRILALVTVISLLLTLLGFLLAPRQTLYSWLFAYSYWASLGLGALAWLLTFHAANSRWPTVILRPLELMGATGIALAVLFLPIAVGMNAIYPWVTPDPARGEHFLELMRHKGHWLGRWAFLFRAVLCFAAFAFVGERMLALSARQDVERAVGYRLRMRAISSVALPIVGLAMTFASFDWLMSLQPEWYSTIFGLYWFSGGFVAANALWIRWVAHGEEAGLFPALVTPSHYHSMGKLLLSFVCFWAYIAFSQLLLIWIGDLPAEMVFYTARRGPWLPVSLLLPLFHFVIPFLLLLSRDLKRDRRRLSWVALWVLCAHLLDSWWLVVPVLRPTPRIAWQDVTAFLTVGGALAWLTLFRFRGRLPAPVGDPWFDQSARYAK